MTGRDEIATGSVTLKNMSTGEQATLPAADLVPALNA
jgi:histidyl-tRNA synthetase